jgi:CelD/BcsL family acetyltransferase involved in cellulose biosynthesis
LTFVCKRPRKSEQILNGFRMSLAATIPSRGAADDISADSRIAEVAVHTSMAAAEPDWRALEQSGALMTPYQRLAFQAAWHRHVGAIEGATPFIVVAYNRAREPLMLLPLALRREIGVGVARYFGGKHVTFNMPLYRRDFAWAATQSDLDAVLLGLRRTALGCDVLALNRQPAQWSGTANPLKVWPSQPSVNDCPVMRINPDHDAAERISNSFRRRLKGKERKLRALPGYSYHIATDADSIRRTLDMFFAVKPLRMAEQKLPNVFADPGIQGFIRETCANRTIALHTLRCDDEVIAMFAGVDDNDRFSMMFNTYTMSANAKYSPGLILLRDIVDHYAARGATALDLGVGSDDYKRLFCKDDESIFDSYLGLNARGNVAAALLASFDRLKRAVKRNDRLLRAAQMVRGAVAH